MKLGRRSLTLWVLAVLLLPSVIIVNSAVPTAQAAPTSRQELVDFVAGEPVHWEPHKTQHALYFRYDEGGPQSTTDDLDNLLLLEPANRNQNAPRSRQYMVLAEANVADSQCPDPDPASPTLAPLTDPSPADPDGNIAGTGASQPASRACFIYPSPFTHDVTVRGKEAFYIFLPVLASTDLTWNVIIRGTGTTGIIGRTTFDQGNSSSSDIAGPSRQTVSAIVPVSGPDGKAVIKKDTFLIIEIFATNTIANVPGVGDVGNGATWSLYYNTDEPGDDQDARKARLIMTTEDAIKTATWTEREARDSPSQTAFKRILPQNILKKEDWKKNNVTLWFAAKSGFGMTTPISISDRSMVNDFKGWSGADTVNGRPAKPQATLYYDNTSLVLYGETSAKLVGDATRTQAGNGISVWRSEHTKDRGVFNITSELTAPAGRYSFDVTVPLRTGDMVQTQVPTSPRVFLVTDSQIVLEPYDDPATVQIDETASHLMESGKTTTFVLSLQNTGSSTDTITLTTTPLREDGGKSWQPFVKGPRLIDGNKVTLRSGERTLVTFTVQAPEVGNGASSLYLLTAKSGLDPDTQSEVVVTSTVSTNPDSAKYDVGLIALNTSIFARPAQEGNQTVYIWNRGTRTMNVTGGIDQTPDPAWSNATFKLADQRRDTKVVYSVAAGDIRAVEVGITPGRTLGAKANYKFDVNASNPRAPAVAQKTIFVEVKVAYTFHLEVLRNRGDAPRVLERYTSNIEGFSGDSLTNRNTKEYKDNLSGTWVRIWVVNDGDVSQNFEATVNSEAASGLAGNVWGSPTFGTKSLDGRFQPATGNTVVLNDVPARQAGEFYIWLPLRDTEQSIDDPTLELVSRLNVKVESRTTKQTRFTTIDFNGANDNTRGGVRAAEVFMEPVARIHDPANGFSYDTRHLVDLSTRAEYLKGKNELEKITTLGGTATYRLRVTHGGSWGSFEPSPPGTQRDFVSSNATLELRNPYRDLGWIAEMRFVDDPSGKWSSNLIMDNTRAVSSGVPKNGDTADAVSPTRQAWIDREVEVRVRAPSGEDQGRLVSGDLALVSLVMEIKSPGSERYPGDYEEFKFKTRIVGQPDLKIEPCTSVGCGADKNSMFLHAGTNGHWIINASNNGGREGVFTLESKIVTSTGGSWGSPQPTKQVFNLTAHENRTLALSIRAPPGANAGDSAEVNVTASYVTVPGNLDTLVRKSIRLVAEVKEKGKVEITVDRNTTDIRPLERQSFTIQIKNTGPATSEFDLTTTLLPNWTRTISPKKISLQSGEVGAAALLVQAPGDIVRGREYELVMRITDRNDEANFVTEVFRFVTTGGEARPRIVVDQPNVIVNRTEIRKVEVGLQNTGNVEGRFALEVVTSFRSGEQPWKAWVVDEFGENVTDTNGDGYPDILVKPKERRNVNVTINAPYSVPEGTVKTVTLRALTPDLRSSVEANLKATIHDYGVEIRFPDGRNTIDIVPGFSGSIPVRIRNIGNANDTANLSLDVNRNLGWTYQFSQERIFLTPDSWGQVQLIVSSPARPLPTPRQTLMVVYAGSVGGAPVNFTKLVNLPVFVNVLDYRVADVDGDGQREIAVDLDKNRANGFEVYREVYEEGLRSQGIEKLKGRFDQRTKHLIDVEDATGAFDGIGDYYWDPDDSTQTPVANVMDFDRDGTLDYFLDLDGNSRVDVLYNTVTGQYLDVLGRDFEGNGRQQYLIDEDGDGIYDKYANPDENVVTRVSLETGERYGIDTTNDGKVNRYYDPRTGSVVPQSLEDFGDFAKRYWYFFAAFALVVGLFLVVVVRRRRM